MSNIRRLVLDILKPHEPGMEKFGTELSGEEDVEAVNLTLIEVDEEVENVKATIEGERISLDDVRSKVDELGGSIHSVDEIVCGSRIIEQVDTPQD